MTEYIKITPSSEMRAAVLAAAGLPDLAGFEPMSDEEWAEFRDFDANYETFPADAPTMPAGLVVGSREHRAFSAHAQAGVEAIKEASK